MISSILHFVCILLLPGSVFAAKKIGGIGYVAQNIMDPVNLISDFVNSACFLIGGSFLLASLIKYREHRRNPLMVPLSTVFFLMIAGTILVLMPLITLRMD